MPASASPTWSSAASPRADGLTNAEYRAGADRVEALVAWLAPAVVCFAGLTGYRTARERGATTGEQVTRFGGAVAYVMPNPSGINAHARLEDLTEHLRRAAVLAGTIRRSTRSSYSAAAREPSVSRRSS